MTTAMATTSTAVTPPRTHHHVFAYLDEPDVVQGEWQEVAQVEGGTKRLLLEEGNDVQEGE